VSTILITGAHGFLGRHAAKAFAAKGDHVVGVGHGSWDEAEWRSWGLSEWSCADVTQQTVAGAARGAAVIVHCAGGSSVAASIDRPDEDRERTVTTTREVLEVARAGGLRMVLPSSAAVYGRARSLPIDENAETAPVSPYGRNKLDAETLCITAARESGVPVAVVRFFSVYGEGLRKQLLWDACVKARRGESGFGGTGRETRDLLHVTDAAALLVMAAANTSEAASVVNGGTGIAVSTAEIVTTLFEALGVGTAPLFSGVGRPGDPEHYQASTARARAWGWEPRVGWKDGVRAYAAWHRKNAP
jgi:UDP-glucose 4-epimerase